MSYVDHRPHERTVPPFATALIGLVVVHAALITGLALASSVQYRKLIRESGPIEDLSAIWWALAAVIALAALAFPSVRRRRSALAYGLAAAFFVVNAGEEISWGQRIFGFEGPEALVEINQQQETNLHNTGSLGVYATAFMLLTFSVFVAWPVLLKAVPAAARPAERHRLPTVTRPASLIYLVWVCVWVIVGSHYDTLGPFPHSSHGYYPQLDDEILEYGSALAFLCLVSLDLREIHSPRT